MATKMKKLAESIKVNADAPGQHTAILALSGIFIFLSFVEWIKAPSKDVLVEGPRMAGETIYENPNMHWYEKYLCRGYQRASFCSYRMLHPFKSVLDDNGIRVEERPPEKNVIRYRGPLPSNRSLSNKIVLSRDE